MLVFARLIANVWFGMYSRRWRFASVPDLERIVAATSMGSSRHSRCVPRPSQFSDRDDAQLGFPRSFWLVEALLAVAILGGVRFAIRAASE